MFGFSYTTAMIIIVALAGILFAKRLTIGEIRFIGNFLFEIGTVMFITAALEELPGNNQGEGRLDEKLRLLLTRQEQMENANRQLQDRVQQLQEKLAGIGQGDRV